MSNLGHPSDATTAAGKRAILAERLRQAADPNQLLPLSFAQQRLWFLDQLEPNSPLYNIPTVARLSGRLDAGALERALTALVARHEALRTRFVDVEGDPAQRVEREARVGLRRQDLTGLAGLEREAEARRLMHEEMHRPFNLSTDALLRALLLQLGTEEHLLVVTMHHIVSDEWSLRIFYKELGAYYAGFSTDQAVVLPELQIQYGDYALWQRDWLQGEVLEEQLGFWKRQLSGNPPVLELPADQPRRATPSFRGSHESRPLEPSLSEGLKSLARRHTVTMFMLLLAAFKALLHRYTRQEDLVVGAPVAGRTREETEGLIGFFVNTLPLRTQVSGEMTFEQVLARVRETALDAYAHQEVPFEKMVEELQPERSLSHLPFTRVMFLVQNAPFEQVQWPGLKLELLDATTDTAKFDLTLGVQETGHGLVARVEYNTDLFETATVQRLLRHFELLLRGVVAEPKSRICDLPLLAEEERQEVLVDWNATSTPYPRDKCIHELFEACAEREPQARAVVSGEESLSYGELNARANRLARHLRERFKVGPDVPVGVCLERSLDLVVGLLGILKAGGAYVPLDPGYPRERLRFMLQDTQAPVLLTHQRLLPRVLPSGEAGAARLDALDNARVICLDADWELIAPESEHNLPNLASPESLAYVIYTSGSTGQPKGVAVPHRAVNRLVLDTNYVRIGAADRLAHVSNVSFDAATFELWGALLNGAELVVISQDVALSPRDFARELREQGITTMFLTAALFNQFAAEAPGAFQTLRTVIAGGEALEPKWVRAVLKNGPPRRLVNGYGPTENTTFTCCHQIRYLPPEAVNVPIGQPISNTKVYILDPQLNPVPVGVPGELYAGGDGLARGYWNRPELNAERFVPNPFAPAGSRQLLYRTGDLARFRLDGSIEYLGRLDRQVKLRGFRIELGEVEAALSRHSGVRECVVIACGSTAAERRLVAYFIPANDPAPNASELHGFMGEHLPEYMVPSAFVRLSVLPLTPNGKVDRQALPEPDQARPALERQYVAPRDEVERQLSQIWEQVLGVQPVGVADKFFDLGGHSLLAVRVVAKIDKVFGRKLRLATIFQAPTIEQLAAILREEVKESSITTATSLVAIQAEGSRPPLFLVHGAGGGMFWGYLNLSRHLGPNQPVYAFKSRGLDGREELASIPAMASQYLADLRSLQPKGPYYLGGYCFGGDVAYEMARQLQALGEEVGLVALLNCAPPNSRYNRIPWTPLWAGRFLRNLCYWVNYFRQWTPAQRHGFFRWKWAVLKRRLTGSDHAERGALSRIDAADLVDLSSYSEEERKLWEAHIRALLAFHPQPCDAPVHLFRSSGHPLWCSFDPDFGWGDLARAGVKMTIVPGSHEKVLEEPCVKVLAAELAGALRESQKSASQSETSAAPEQDPEPDGGPGEPQEPLVCSGPRADFPVEATYPQHFVAQVERTPGSVALRFGDQDLTYAELNARANALAHYLQSLSVGPEVVVGVSLERSLELMVALLAVLKAGGAYLPLDPDYPELRLRYMLADSRARVLLTQGKFRALAEGEVKVICLDAKEEQARLARSSVENPSSQVAPDGLAYVIYTSGSTGAPKGVEVSHRSLLSHNFAVAQAFRLEPKDRVLQFTPLSFDVSVEEIFPTWLHGGAVIVRTEEAISSMGRFLDLVERERITVLDLPTAYWHELVEAMASRVLPASVRLVVVGGERASDTAFKRWKERVSPNVTLMNGYGVTEATVTTTLGVARADEDGLPIGRPLANTHVVLLDARLRPVGPGQAGELCIGGLGVARGYLNRPELTAARFIPNPGLRGLGSSRLYRTGDLARLRPDGELEFLGRQDQQVKVRGFRIELGEIEAVLLSHPGVKEAAVIPREDQPGRQRLVGYFVPRTPPGPRVSELLKYLRAKVPDYMAPAAFVPMAGLPRTPAGKVDRAALPAPTKSRPELDEPLVAPRTPVEEVLAEIWAEVLDLNPVGVNDNLFELGGHSLLAMQILSRLRDQLQVELTLESLFARPTITLIAEHLADASERTRPVLPASVLARGEQRPLTSAQRRIWFLDQFEPHRAAYNRPVVLRLQGSLNLAALERSLSELSQRHPVLRAVFPARDGEPIQLICEPREVYLPRVDLSGEPAATRETRALELCSRRGRQPYITFRPMLRPLLLRLGPAEHWLFVGLHALGVDSRSVRVLVDELVALYSGFDSHEGAGLASVPADHAEPTKSDGPTSKEQAARDRAYWKTKLAGAPPLLELPTDRPRPPHHGTAGARQTFDLPPPLVARLEALSGNQSGNLFSVLLAGFGTVLHRYTGLTDLVIGSVFPGRSVPETERSVGCLDNPLALRCDLTGDPSFRELFERLQASTAAAWAHGNFPFEALLEELEPERNASYAPVIQVLFVLEEDDLSERRTGELTWVPLELDNQTAKYDLTLHFVRRGERLAGWVEYSTDLFEPGRIARLAEHLQTLLIGAAANPEQRISALPLLSVAERHKVLVEWNSTAVEYPRERCLHELIESQVERTPEATALVFEGQRLSYAQLNARANQLAHRLRALEVGPDTLVGLCLERSLEMVVALLGTLKAGGAYVPLDPEYPRDRLAFMLQDAQVPVLLTQQRLREGLPKARTHVLSLDSEWPAMASESSQNPPLNVQPHHLAYMIYTSGSTGRPKGALNTHLGIVNRLLWMQDAYRLSPSERVLQKTPFSFDVSVWEFFWPLLTGAGLVLARPGGHRDAAYLARLIAQEQLTTLHFVPSMLRLFLEEPGLEESCASVRRVICSGEALPLDLQQRFFQRLSAELHNLYGPTEAAVDVTYWACQRGTRLRTVPIGRPIANTQIYLLDRSLQPVPLGVPGELHIGGVGLARGYHRRPELTAEKFIPNPFSPEPGARLYKTGDSARYLEDGNIEYLGRLDYQVKIRGYRIELGEIEAALKEHPGVGEALVLAREEGPGDKRLVAFIVPAGGQAIADQELRGFLEPKLPGYMVPTAFVQLEALALTPNGKVDRKALTALKTEQPSSKGFVAPRNPVEEQLAGIWREVLLLNRVGAEDNFFDLGGDSLLAIRVLSRIREVFRAELPLFRLFNAPTVAALAEGLAGGQWSQNPGLVLPLEPVSREGSLPVSFVQERLWFLDQLEPGSHAYNVPMALRLKGDLNAAALEHALNEVVRRHEALRTTYSYVDDQLMQVIRPSLQVDLERMPEPATEPIETWLKTEAWRPFDLEHGPLVRAGLARVAEGEHALLVVMHHSVCDGWSLALLFQELAALYTAFQAGQAPPPLPELPVQYADFAYWQRRWMRGAVLGQELKYWQEKLAGAPPAVSLPADHPEPAQPTSRGGRRTVRVPEAVVKGTSELGHRRGDTPFMVLMSALAITLNQWTAQEDLVIGTVVAGRNRRETENLIGCFMNFLPIRTRVRRNDAGQDVLAWVRASVLEAQTHQDCPFERIVEALNPRRSINRNPLYNVALLLQNFPAEPFRTETLQASAIPIAMDAALLDLRFEVEHAGSELLLSCEYRTDLFEANTIDELLACFGRALDQLVREPHTLVAEFRLTRALAGRASTEPSPSAASKVAIAATFTAEPLQEPLRRWLEELDLRGSIEFAPYHQVFQELLDPGSLLSGNQQGLNVVLMRLEDWRRPGTVPASTGGPISAADLERTAGEFVGALRTAAGRSSCRWLVGLCPPSKPVAEDPEWAGVLARLESSLVAELGRVNGVEVLTAADLARWYPVPDYYDAGADELGHVPYTPVFFTSLATALARRYDALSRSAHKVIVLDCDQTLWAGVCGEDGAQGVRLDGPYLALQQFMRAQSEAGRLLCLCSKNNEADVDDVFARRGEMPLRPQHFVARRLNWQPKSENLKALARELQLGLDAFILVDDNPVECAEVEANCPEVLTLRLPDDPERFPEFLEHCWVFDSLKQTAEDRRRSELYQQNRQREQLRSETRSLAQFLAGLELQVQIEPVGLGQLPRVAQLTQRTNQFNCTTRRRTEGELELILGGGEGLVVSVRDRFGNYGLVGVMLFETRAGTLEVDSFLLSCRVLGRGVEHRMLARLGALAQERGCRSVKVHFTNTAKNQPALRFLDGVGAQFKQGLNGGWVYCFPASFAAEVTFHPSDEPTAAPAPEPQAAVQRLGREAGRVRGFRRYGELALRGGDVLELHERFQAGSMPVTRRGVAYVAPRTEVECTLCQLWEEVLHLQGVGVNDNFFELGGHSLLAVQLNSRIRSVFLVELPMQSLFEAQTIAALAEGLATDTWKPCSSRETPLRPVSRPQRLPLSFAQQRLWFLDQLEPNSPLYNVPVMARLRGALDLGALERSLNAIVVRHEALRTRLVGTSDGPVQVVENELRLQVRFVDLSQHPEAEREPEAQSLAREEANQPFNLSTGPLLRALVLKLKVDEHLLVLNLHHIVSDEWSVGVLFRELVALYGADARSEQAQLPELPVQYADYAVWQRQWLQGEVLEKQLGFWKQQLTGLPPITELPPDHRPPPPPRFRGGTHKRVLDQELSLAVKELARREEATVFMVLLAGFKALLHRYNQQQDLVVAAPSAGRNRVEIENLIGFFVNTLPLRTDLSGNPTFSELLHRVRTVTLGAYAHQDLPFDKMVEAVQPERSLSHLPFTRLMFGVQHSVPEEMQLPRLRLQFLEMGSDTAKFDLTLIIEETRQGMLARAEYNSDLFEAATIQRLLQQYETLLRGIAAEPHLRLSELPLLGQPERQELLARWSRTRGQSPSGLCLHQWFETQAERTPDAVAVVCGQQRLTYGQLNAQASQLAHYLEGLGVGPEVPVALCLERSLSMVVAILGVLKAGGAYVPMDPAYPKERLSFILQDTRAPVLLTESNLCPKFPLQQGRFTVGVGTSSSPVNASVAEGEAGDETSPPRSQALKVVCLDSEWDKISSLAAPKSDGGGNPHHPAYIIYTSGSTGTPKGVVVTHYNVVRLFQQTEPWYEFKSTDVWTLFHSYTFDFSVWELWGALLYGGRLVMVPYLISRSPAEFYRLLSNEKVTVLNQTPSAFRQLLWAEASASSPLPLSLRYVIFGGEALELQSLKPWFERHGDEQPLLVNMYGITETTVHVTYRPIRAADLSAGISSVIGVPIPDLRLYLLDERLEPVPVGVPGEICVGGAGVARGYLNRPELSQERFLADPLASQAGARLYRSGDLARYTASGELEYLGRIDGQVKVRGFRVELGEIESALNRHPGIRESVVVAAADGAVGATRLVAYFVSTWPAAPAVSELREFLARSLPEHMIPSLFVLLESLPLTANGKVDRRALPKPEPKEVPGSGSPVPPRNPTEARLTEIWCEVLGRASVGIQDNFFHLGGHSLLATQVMFRIADAFQVEVPVRALFEQPTIEALATAVARQQREEPECSVMIRRRPAGEARPYPLSFAQEMLWVLDRLEPDSPLYNIPLVARLHGNLNEDRLQQALEAVVARHEVLRTRLVDCGGTPAQMVDAETAVPLSREDLSGLPEAEREAECQRRVQQESQRPFKLGAERLVRATLLRLGPEEHVLALNLHHSIFDEWSLGIFLRELTAFYTGLTEGRSVSLPELPIQYADYALWEREHLQGEVLQRHLEFWNGQLAGYPAPTELPTDHSRPVAPASRGRLETRLLSRELSEGLKQLAVREDATSFIILLAAFNALLFRYTRQEDLVVASPMAGRHRAETEGLLGCFVNILPLRTRISGDPTFAELLGQVRELALGAYAHQDLPFRKLVEALHPERSPNHMPFTNLMFLVQNTVVESLQWPGVTLEFVGASTETSKFDLTLLAQETQRGLVLQAEYKTDLFEAETIQRLLGHFETLLAGIIANPGEKLSALPLMPESERQQVLVEWNRTEQQYPRDKTLVDLFEEQVARTPEAEALVCCTRRLSYRELDARSGHVAQRLRDLGVGAEVPVGICLHRSWEMVAGILGVLKAGGAYVPLDPAYPQERLAFMLQDAGVRVLLTRREESAKCEVRGANSDLRVLCVEDFPWDPPEGSANSDLAITGAPQEPGNAAPVTHHPSRIAQCASSTAYVIYTSGSTGKPKGVALEHGGAVALVHWAKGVYSPQELSGVLAATSICFDLSVFELFVPLSWGGKVILAENALALEELPAAAEVTLVNTVPSAMRELLRLRALPESVRVVNLAGEPLSSDLVEQIYRETSAEKVYDLYGPTETTTYSTFTLRRPGAAASIGRPLTNEQVYVLNAQFLPVPVGVPGELFIGGVGLARGYVNRPELTAERFIANPFLGGGRMYRTGDLARWRADGTLEYLGRLDHQVKLRGFRIELGEIEAALRQHPAVKETLVLARGSLAGNQQLVAYVVAQPGQTLMDEELRHTLEARLPAYMVPASFVVLPALPLTPNGKVDRKALASMPLRPAAPEADRVAPRTATERMLAGIWCQVLDLESVGVQDNFFRVGGHSLLAVRLFALIEEATGRKLPVVTLFQAPTIEQLARALCQAGAEATPSLLVPIQPTGHRAPLFLVHGAGGDVLWGYANLASHLSPEQPVYGIKSRGQAGLPELSRVEDMAACYLEAVRAFQPVGPYLLGGYCFGGNVAYEMARQLLAQGERVALLVLLDSAPANIGYEVPGWWHPAYLRHFMRNLGYWMADFASLRWSDRRTFVARKLRAFGRRLARRARREPGPATIDLEGFIDLSHFSEAELKLWRIHLQAVSEYIQPSYPGAVTLLRTRGQPLFCSLDEDFCWGQVARGGVVVRPVPGSHESIFTSPNVEQLAQELELCLQRARAAETL